MVRSVERGRDPEEKKRPEGSAGAYRKNH